MPPPSMNWEAKSPLVNIVCGGRCRSAFCTPESLLVPSLYPRALDNLLFLEDLLTPPRLCFLVRLDDPVRDRLASACRPLLLPPLLLRRPELPLLRRRYLSPRCLCLLRQCLRQQNQQQQVLISRTTMTMIAMPHGELRNLVAPDIPVFEGHKRCEGARRSSVAFKLSADG